MAAFASAAALGRRGEMYQGDRYNATRKREFRLSLREAGPPRLSTKVVNKGLSLGMAAGTSEAALGEDGVCLQALGLPSGSEPHPLVHGPY